jgi:drug/metabolite transporter (DMT)-like permease
MKNLLIYLTTIFIWGTTWLAIKFQVGQAPLEVSIFYRFTLASLLLLTYCKIKNLSLKFNLRDHGYLFLLGLCMFSLHLLLVYASSLYLVSGLVSVIFSLVSLFNILNSFIFYKKRPEIQMVLGACLGFAGIALFFWNEIGTLSFQSRALLGAGYGLLGALLFSFGNMVSRRNQSRQLPLVPSSAIAMGYGASIMLLYCLLQRSSFVVPQSLSYWSSLLYLTIPGSVVAFLCYLSLVKRIGPERAGYATVFFPVVALGVSILFENYRLTACDIAGIACVLAGNFLVMFKKKAAADLRNS